MITREQIFNGVENDKCYGVKGVAHLFDEREEKNDVKIIRYKFLDSENFLYNLRAVRDGGPLFHVRDGEYVKLIVNGELMMSDTGLERRTSGEFIQNANGKVLIGGLGLGLVLYNLIDNPKIESITVVEKSQDVIDLVAPKMMNQNLKIICDDIFTITFDKSIKFDTMFFDIWPNPSTDMIPEINQLHRKFRKHLNKDNPNYWMGSWMHDYLKRLRRQEQSYNRW